MYKLLCIFPLKIKKWLKDVEYYTDISRNEYINKLIKIDMGKSNYKNIKARHKK